MPSTYMKKLKDPRWQKKRLEVLERDKWTCQICEDKEKTLHVHHTYYEKGIEPWDCLARTMITLCEDCHKKEKGERKRAERKLLFVFRDTGWLSADIEKLVSRIYKRNLVK